METREAVSVIVGRMPRNGNEFKTLFIKVFSKPEPLTQEMCEEEVILPNIEKAVFNGKVPEYYLEGNDLVWDNITSVSWTQEENTVTVRVD